jgi:hypothetical protein
LEFSVRVNVNGILGDAALHTWRDFTINELYFVVNGRRCSFRVTLAKAGPWFQRGMERTDR